MTDTAPETNPNVLSRREFNKIAAGTAVALVASALGVFAAKKTSETASKFTGETPDPMFKYLDALNDANAKKPDKYIKSLNVMAKDYLKLMKKGQKIEGDPYPNNLSVVIDTTLGRTRLHFDAKRTKLIASTDSPEIIDFLQLDKNGKNPVVVPDEKMEDFLDFIEKPENLKSVVAIRLVSANSLIRNIPDELLKEINNYRNDKDLELPPLQVMEMQGLSISFNKGTCTKYADYRLDIIANYGSKGQPPALTITKVQESKSGANDSYFVREKEKIDNIFSGTTDKGNLLFPESYLKLTGKAMEIVDKAKHILNPNK